LDDGAAHRQLVKEQETNVLAARDGQTAKPKSRSREELPMKRLNPFTAAPEGIAVLTKVQDYVRTSGFEPRLLALVRTRVSQMNGYAYFLHMHTATTADLNGPIGPRGPHHQKRGSGREA
jgi:hypothetical protein